LPKRLEKDAGKEKVDEGSVQKIHSLGEEGYHPAGIAWFKLRFSRELA